MKVVWEWPDTCVYWEEYTVKLCMLMMKFAYTTFDGCQYDLRSVTNPDHFLRKRWRIGTNIPDLLPLFCAKCPGQTPDHVHDQACGANAVHSQYYTPDIATLMHLGIYKFVQTQSHSRSYQPRLLQVRGETLKGRAYVMHAHAGSAAPLCNFDKASTLATNVDATVGSDVS